MNKHSRLQKQQGTAIIMALFLVGIVAVIAVTMMARLSRDIRRTDMLLQSTQAELYAQGSLLWAIDTLRFNWINQKKNQLIDTLPMSSPENTYNQFKISSTIYDAQGLFNLNNLVTDDWSSHFQNLVHAVAPEIPIENAQKITKSVSNWVASSSKNAEEDAAYTKLPQAYRAAHQLMASPSELRLVNGITPQLYTRLLPYITALPETTLINVNTAAAPVLQSLSPTLPLDAAKSVETFRQTNPFVTTDQFLNMDVIHNHNLPGNRITVSSQYFLVKTTVEKNQQQLIIYTLLHRVGQNGKAIIHVLWQSKGSV